MDPSFQTVVCSSMITRRAQRESEDRYFARTLQPPTRLNLHAMLRDTLSALDQLPEACDRFRTRLPSRAHNILAELEITVRRSLDPAEAYSMVPGHNPQNR